MRKLWEICEKFVRKLWESCEKVVRKLWESCEKVVRKLSESRQKVVKKMQERCEKVVRKLWESCEKVLIMVWESCKKIVRKLSENLILYFSCRPLSRHVCSCPFSPNLSEFRCTWRKISRWLCLSGKRPWSKWILKVTDAVAFYLNEDFNAVN